MEQIIKIWSQEKESKEESKEGRKEGRKEEYLHESLESLPITWFGNFIGSVAPRYTLYISV